MADADADSLDGVGSEEDQTTEPELSRAELLALNPFALRNFSRHKIRYMAVFDTEKWYPELSDVTFPTESLPVTWEEGLAVAHFFQEGCCNQKGKITAQDKAQLTVLKDKIEQLFFKLGPRCPEPAFFVRMGPRSPKDAPLMASEPWGVSEEKIRGALLRTASLCPPSSKTACDLLRFFQTASYSILRSSSPEEALALLVASSRVMEDISHTMDQGRDGWDFNVVARAWDSNVSLDREFRTFVVGGCIAAISQYDDQLCYDFVPAHLEVVVEAISRCLDKARPGLERLELATSTSAVVADFVIVPGSTDSAWDAKVIELNPFGPMTGASLFTWTYDRRVLQGGKDLFGDLEQCELNHPPDQRRLPAWIKEEAVGGIPFRFLSEHPPNFSMDHLEAFWPDYMRLAPPGLLA